MQKSITQGIALFLLLFIIRPAWVVGFPAKKVYEQTVKNVVLVAALSDGESGTLGTGSIISKKGLVITNAHVVIEKKSLKPYKNIRVYLKPDKVTGKYEEDLINGYEGKVLDYTQDLDLAVVELKDSPKDIGIIELADPAEIKIGEEVAAIGHPEGGGLWILTRGTISGAVDNFSDIPGKDVFQTDTDINRGNSGGPLLDQRGYMVAVNSNIARLSGDKLPITGVNFAIKSSVVNSWLNSQGYTISYGQEPLTDSLQEEKPQKKPNTHDDNFQTPRKPYKYEELLKAAEKDLEKTKTDMFERIKENMSGRIKEKRFHKIK